REEAPAGDEMLTRDLSGLDSVGLVRDLSVPRIAGLRGRRPLDTPAQRAGAGPVEASPFDTRSVRSTSGPGTWSFPGEIRGPGASESIRDVSPFAPPAPAGPEPGWPPPGRLDWEGLTGSLPLTTMPAHVASLKSNPSPCQLMEVNAMAWETPEFVEVRMDAEINSYQDDFDREQDDRF